MGLPENLLLAVGIAETGQRDRLTGRLRPEPYSVNVGGTDVVFQTAAYAIDAVAAMRVRGVRSIDVGCFQVNLQSPAAAVAAASPDSRMEPAFARAEAAGPIDVANSGVLMLRLIRPGKALLEH